MKKRNQDSPKSNLLFFPNLKERLLKKGLDFINQKKYIEASELLLQAAEIDEEDAEVGTALMIALYQCTDYKKAKVQGKKMLNEGIGDYFEIMDLFLMTLIQLGDHEEMVTMIRALIDERELPPDKLQHYEKLLEFGKNRLSASDLGIYIQQEKRMLFETDDLQDQVIRISQLVHENIQPYIEEIRSYIQDPDQHPFIQTLLISVLREHEIADSFAIRKFYFEDTIIPKEIIPIFETPFYNALLDVLTREVEQQNPTLFMSIKAMIDRHFFLLYPFELEPIDVNLWAAAYYRLGQRSLGQENEEVEYIADIFEVDSLDLTRALAYLDQLDEISLPNM